MSDTTPEDHPTPAEREEAASGGDGAPETVPDAYEQAADQARTEEERP